MRAWKLVEEPVVGHWTFVGASEDLLACRSDWVPVVDKNGLPLCLPMAPLGAYSTVQLPGCGYKELFHRQVLQDLLGRQLPDNVDVHHRDGDKANNCGRNLEAMPRSYHRRLRLQQRPLKSVSELGLGGQLHVKHTTQQPQPPPVITNKALQKHLYP